MWYNVKDELKRLQKRENKNIGDDTNGKKKIRRTIRRI